MEKECVNHYNLLDLARVYCACLVIFIHMGVSTSIIPCLARQAVPFFFLVSGFFFGKRDLNTLNVLSFARKYARTLLLIYAVWALFWTPFFVKEAVDSYIDRSVLYVILVVIRRVFLAGAAQYWYLLVLAEGVLLLAIVMRFKIYWLGWVMCILGLTLRFVFDMHFTNGVGALIYKVFYTVFSWDCNVVMTGFPLLFLGSVFARNNQFLSFMRRTIIGILYLVSVLLAFVIYGISHSHYGIPFWLIEALLLFLFCILPSKAETKIPSTVCKTARNLSSVIYLTHTAFLILFGNVFHIWDTITSFVLCILGACLLTYLIKIINWPPLNKLMMVR